MIFVTVGVQLPFDRLIHAMDEWAAANPQIPVIAQTGATKLPCSHMSVHSCLTGNQFQHFFETAELIVAHAGMGSILTALEMGKPIIVLPRSAALGEHRNDHQAATSKHMLRADLVRVATSADDLKTMVDQRHLIQPRTISPQAQPSLISALSQFIKSGKNATAAR